MKKILTMILAVALTAGFASASLIVTAPNVTLAQGESTVANVMISGGDAIAGVTLIALIGDGGPTLGGTLTSPPAPVFTDATVIAGVFNATNTPSESKGAYPDLFAYSSAATSAGTTVGNGILAQLSISVPADAVPGVYALVLGIPDADQTSILNTAGGSMQATLVAGSITVTPEPAALALLGLGGLLIRRRRA